MISPLLKETKMIMCIVGLGYLFIGKNHFIKLIKFTYLNLINFFK